MTRTAREMARMNKTSSKNQKLVISIVQKDDAPQLLEALQREKYGTIVLSSSGGFLRRGNATLLTIVNQWYVDAVIRIIQDNASERNEIRDPGISLQVSEWYIPDSVQVHVGGASVWVLDASLAGFIPYIGNNAPSSASKDEGNDS